MTAFNLTFNYFKHKYPGSRKVRDLAEDELGFIRANFPGDVEAFFAEEGVCSYADGYFHFVSPWTALAIPPRFLMSPQEHLVFLRTAFGDFFTWNGSRVSLMRVAMGRLSEMSDDMTVFFKFALGDADFVDQSMYRRLYEPARARLGELDCDECFGSTTDSLPFRGGKPIHLIRKFKWLDYLDAWAGAHHPKPAP